MPNTNTKEVSKKIQEHILNNFESYESMMAELKNYQKNFGDSFGKIFAQEGNLLIYESEIDKFFQDALNQTPEEQKKYSSKETWELYTNLIQRESAHIVSEGNRCYIKPDSIKIEKPKESENLSALQNLKRATDILATGESQSIENKEFGKIFIDKGLAGKNGYGLMHIIENRAREGKKDDETAAIVHLVTESAKEGNVTRSIADKASPEKARRAELEKDGIIALVSLHRNHSEEKWVLTGFDNRNKKEEAAEAIQTVIAKYGRTPEFSYFRKQVGAAVSSLQQSSRQASDKSSGVEAAKKAGYVQGVCECVAAVGSDYALGKKLLTEMSVSQNMAKEYAKPETLKALEEGVFARNQEHKLERAHRRKR